MCYLLPRVRHVDALDGFCKPISTGSLLFLRHWKGLNILFAVFTTPVAVRSPFAGISKSRVDVVASRLGAFYTLVTVMFAPISRSRAID